MAEVEQVVNRRQSMDDGSMRLPLSAFIEVPPPNYTDPNEPMFVDIFKGKDDENFLFKSLLLTKFTGYASAFMILVDATVGTRPTDLAGLLKRVGYWGVPLIGGGIAYTSTVCLVSSVRNKNDQFNHLIGGGAVGAVAGACRKSIFYGTAVGVFIGLLGLTYKDSIMGNYQIHTPPRPRMQGLSISHRHDYSLWPKGITSWTRGPAPPVDC